MALYKLNIAFDFEHENPSEAVLDAMAVLRKLESSLPEVSLTRHGDRSGANLLAPVPNTSHYKHGKVPITEVLK